MSQATHPVPLASPALARRDVAALLQRYHRDRDPTDREAIIRQFLPLARSLARKYNTANEREDIEQVATIGLLKAIDRFDPTQGSAFTSYATPTILGEIKRYFRDHGWSVHVPRSVKELSLRCIRATDELTHELARAPTAAEVADHCQTTIELVLEARASATAHRADSLDAPVGDDDNPADVRAIPLEEPGFARAERIAYVDGLLARLPRRDQQILRLRFLADLTQREIAERVGLSQMQVSRCIRTAITELQAISSGVR